MTNNVLGIDFGTSSVKLYLKTESGLKKAREPYSCPSGDGWWNSLCLAAKSLNLSGIKAVGLSSQVGTYVINGEKIIEWSSGIGKEELDSILSDLPADLFEEEISMPHPHIISYPLPRIKHILSHEAGVKRICMTKDLICERLTGNYVSDKFSWRGLANLTSCEYSKKLLSYVGADERLLPKLCEPSALAGFVTHEASLQTSIPEGTPVYVGCNDFFAGLLGMGMTCEGDMFDITGTSEHLGIIERATRKNDGLVFGKYFFENSHYGVTASSGKSLCFGESLFPLNKVSVSEALAKNPPIFLPYLCGERAPIWDSDARGVFFGINAEATAHEMAYSVMEGVAFSIYHIYEIMGKPKAKFITVAGGAAKNDALNLIKATLFGMPIRVCEETDTSAMGAAILAAVGSGACASLYDATNDADKYSACTEPDTYLSDVLKKRYEIYKSLYPTLQNEFKKLNPEEK